MSSWSRNSHIPNAKYENIPSVLLVLEHTIVRGIDVQSISSYQHEQELLLAPANLFVETKDDDTLYVKYIHNVVSE